MLPTHNRCALLARALESVRAAPVPPGLDVHLTVVDNHCTDGTRDLVRSCMASFEGRLSYQFEDRLGKPHALNTGIAATAGALVGLIDDDEEIDHDWFSCIDDAFADPAVDYIGGRCLPRWGSDRPPWLGRHYLGVIGWVENGTEPRDFGPEFPGILTGGNAVLTRAVLQRAGPYSTTLSRTPTRLMGAEDEHLYRRLLLLGAKGRYRPDLIIHHYVPPERLTKEYFRRWSFWCGVSRGLIDCEYPLEVPYVAGVPRFLLGNVARVAARSLRDTITRDVPPDDRFAGELSAWDLAGFVYGKHFYRVPDAHQALEPSIPAQHGGRA